jgi:thioredoxin-related protein
VPVIISEETALPDKKYPNRLKKQVFNSKAVKKYIKNERTLFNLESSILGEEIPYSAIAI